MALAWIDPLLHLLGMLRARIIRMRTTTLLIAVLISLGFGPSLLAAEPVCAPTEPDVEGPFYKPNAPERSSTGRGLVVSGSVRSASDCNPVAGARIEWWAANPGGSYDDEHRATQQADANGRYRYETDFPAGYFFRPPHLHVSVTSPGYRTLITQIYPKRGETSINFDFVLVPN